MTLEEAINLYERQAEELYKAIPCDGCTFDKCMEEHRQVVELLKELKAYREFADWLVKAILEDDWEESADFYAEVLCRKLTKLGKLKIVDNKYMEVNADGLTADDFCDSCASEHRQLADWLRELKKLRTEQKDVYMNGYNEGYEDGYCEALEDSH